MPVIHARLGRVGAPPASPPAPQAKLRVIAVCEELFVEETDVVEHLAAVKGCTPVREEDLALAVILPPVDLAGTASAIEAVRVKQVTCLVDHVPPIVKQYLGSNHPGVRVPGGPYEACQPLLIRNGVVVQERNELAGACPDPGVRSRAETGIQVKLNQAIVPGGVGAQPFPGAIGGSVIDDDELDR
jgi:hypothetical protein